MSFLDGLVACWPFKRRIATVEQWAERNSKLATPDELISASIVRQIAKDFDAWEMHAFDDKIRSGMSIELRARADEARTAWYNRWTKPGCKANYYMINRVLENKALGVCVAYRRVSSYSYEFGETLETKRDMFHINDVPISNKEGNIIINSHTEVQKARDKAKAAAEKALREMQENEQKWNLVERLAGLKRNEFGALVPIETVEA